VFPAFSIRHSRRATALIFRNIALKIVTTAGHGRQKVIQ
jgi:hypothetical protein